MIISPANNRNLKTPLHWPSLIQLMLSVAAIFLLLSAAFIFALTGVSRYFTNSATATVLTEAFMVAGSLTFVGLLVVPSAWYAWQHIVHPEHEPVSRPLPRNFGFILTITVLIMTGGALLLGNWVSQNSQIAWLILPPLNIIATGMPALWVIYLGTRGLLPNSPRHTSGVFASGLVLGPIIILILELFLLVGVGILAVMSIMLNPTLTNQLNGLVNHLHNGAIDTQTIIHSLLPFVTNPGVIFLGFAFISILVPIIEESIKPIGAWFMAGQKITPAQGFGFGVLSGAGFALFENLGNTSGAGDSWALLAGSRISTLFLHSFTAGLVGWGLASAWSERRYLRLAISFVIAVLIHGTWNGMAVLSAAASLQSENPTLLPAGLQQIGTLATVGIFVLGLLILICFFGFNSFLRRTIPGSISPPSSNSAQSLTPNAPPKTLVIDDPSLPGANESDTFREFQDNPPSLSVNDPPDVPVGDNPKNNAGVNS